MRYTIVAKAIDTEQFDSRISAYGRDPLDPGVGSFFEFTGIVPISVPEPDLGSLRLAGLASLHGVALRRAARNRRRAHVRAPAGAAVLFDASTRR